LFLCVGALAGLGGYTGALLADEAGLPILVSVLLGGVAAGIMGGLLS
jgi:hypothetical protein